MIIGDGAMGTELARRGVAWSAPRWSVNAIDHAPEVVESIHRDAIDAGASMILTNTFLAHEQALLAMGMQGQASRLNRKAVALARAAIAATGSSRHVKIFGSMGPIAGGKFSDYATYAEDLADAGVDAILAETIIHVDQAKIASDAIAATGLPRWISVVVGTDGNLLSGDPVAGLQRIRAECILVNCISVHDLGHALESLASTTDGPLGARPNAEPNGDPMAWAAVLASIAAEHPRLHALGGCCGATPEHISALAQAFTRRERPSNFRSRAAPR